MKELLKKAKRGDEAAFLKLFSMHEAWLYRIAYLYVKNESDALDVMQEVAYRTFKNISSLKKSEYFKTWVTRITMNCAVDHIRKNENVVQLGAEHIENTEQLSKSFETEVFQRITLEDLMQVLDAEEKNIILLKYYQEYSFREIAEIVKQPLGTVKSILYRGLHKLRERAKEADFYESVD